MPIYELACEAGHRSETLQAATAPLPACPACGGPTRKVPSRFGVGGTAAVPPPPERMPQTWKGTWRAAPARPGLPRQEYDSPEPTPPDEQRPCGWCCSAPKAAADPPMRKG